MDVDCDCANARMALSSSARAYEVQYNTSSCDTAPTPRARLSRPGSSRRGGLASGVESGFRKSVSRSSAEADRWRETLAEVVCAVPRSLCVVRTDVRTDVRYESCPPRRGAIALSPLPSISPKRHMSLAPVVQCLHLAFSRGAWRSQALAAGKSFARLDADPVSGRANTARYLSQGWTLRYVLYVLYVL